MSMFQEFAELDRARGAFLAKIPQAYQGHTCNLFLDPVRTRGLWRADLVLAAVKHDVSTRGQQAKQYQNQQTYTNLSTLWDAIKQDADGAIILAEWAVAYTLLPQTQREDRKEQKRTEGARLSMQGKEPTPKQLEYLKKQGYRGEIRDRLHASELIDQLIRKETPVGTD